MIEAIVVGVFVFVGSCVVGGISFVPSVQFKGLHSLPSIVNSAESVSEVTDMKISLVSSSSVDRFTLVFGRGIIGEMTITFLFCPEKLNEKSWSYL